MKTYDPRSLLIGNKYKITSPNYDDYDEGLLPEISIVEILQKNKHGILVKNIELDYQYELKYHILMTCKIEEYNL